MRCLRPIERFLLDWTLRLFKRVFLEVWGSSVKCMMPGAVRGLDVVAWIWRKRDLQDALALWVFYVGWMVWSKEALFLFGAGGCLGWAVVDGRADSTSDLLSVLSWRVGRWKKTAVHRKWPKRHETPLFVDWWWQCLPSILPCGMWDVADVLGHADMDAQHPLYMPCIVHVMLHC